jgi:hypothetical protein
MDEAPASKQSRLVVQGCIWDMIEVLIQRMPYRSRWTPVDNFVQLGGIATCLRVSYNLIFIENLCRYFLFN